MKSLSVPYIPRSAALCCLTAALCLLAGGCKRPDLTGFPDFITATEDYFVVNKGEVPEIDESAYELKVSGLVDRPGSFSLTQLRRLRRTTMPVTIECIGGGSLVGTAEWAGFKVYDFLESLGLDPRATAVQYRAADGYFASHTLEQLKSGPVMGALYMNGKPLPPVQGFPLRIINPGYYGAKQPAWVVEMEVIEADPADYWDEFGWDTSPPMAVDSIIFFPESGAAADIGAAVRIGGAAYGGRRIDRVDVSADNGSTWQQAQIVKSANRDHVWVFWAAEVVLDSPGRHVVRSRATDADGAVQPPQDPVWRDGSNPQPAIELLAR